MVSKSMVLPPLVPYPKLSWRSNMLLFQEWETCLDAWISLAEVHLSFSTPDFVRISAKDESLPNFLASYFAETALSHDKNLMGDSSNSKQLRKQAYFLFYKLMGIEKPPESLLRWEVLADVCKVYGKEKGGKVTTLAWSNHSTEIEASLRSVKSTLTEELDAGLKGDLKGSEIQLRRLNHLLHASPEAASFFMAGDDFVDALIGCYKLMNPPLRKVIITTTYLCLIGLTEGSAPKLSSLIDQLYSLNAAAAAHKQGPTNVNDSLVAELVTVTPVLRQIQQRVDASGSVSGRAKSVITTLQGFRKPGGSGRPRLNNKKPNKGKGLAEAGDYESSSIHVHQMSLISQIQDLFPDLGSGFVVKLLEEYHDNTEVVISHLLEGSLPLHLDQADRFEGLKLPDEPSSSHTKLVPHSTPLQLPIRRNIYDDDELDQLTVDASRLHFGRRNPNQTADDVLQDRSTAPNKAAILSALAAFDSDDDERDDTYDVADVGGTVDSANPEESNPENNSSQNTHDEALFRAYKSSPEIFARDATTRRSKERAAIRQETGMTDEALEGWAVMLSRDSRQMRRLETKFATFKGEQTGLESTAWKAVDGEEDGNGNGNRGRGGRMRGQGRGRGGGRGGRGGGNVAATTGDKETDAARQRKEANKGSRANHNRREGRARKMARGGFPG